MNAVEERVVAGVVEDKKNESLHWHFAIMHLINKYPHGHTPIHMRTTEFCTSQRMEQRRKSEHLRGFLDT